MIFRFSLINLVFTAEGVTPSSPTATYNYAYGDSTWGDKLTSYRGQTITYDAIGNPLNYYNGSSYTFTWTGRRLASATKGGLTYTYTYNDEGIRTSKTVNGVTTTYYLNGSQIIGEETSGNLTLYIYDAEGTPIGMQYHASTYAQNVWDTYWFEKNLQGDIVAVYNTGGTKLISYTCDAWGNTTVTYSNGGASTTATKNPFRYRGYYYDSDLELYYLQTRYYDAKIGRFISPDTESVITATPDALTDKNLYAYCDNNPVMRRDDGGEFWHILIGAAVGAVVGAVVSAASQWITTGDINWKSVAVSAGAGALSGAIASTGASFLASGIANAAIDGTEYLITNRIQGDEFSGADFVCTIFFSSVTAGDGVNASKLRGIYRTSKEALETAISPTKIAMYSLKIRNVKTKVAKEIGKTLLYGAADIGFNWADNKFNIINRWRSFLNEYL